MTLSCYDHSCKLSRVVSDRSLMHAMTSPSMAPEPRLLFLTSLLGAMHGVKAIPAEWLEPLELRDVITELAEDLYAFKDWAIGEYSDNEELNQRIWRKYPGF